MDRKQKMITEKKKISKFSPTVSAAEEYTKPFWKNSSFWISCGMCMLPILFGISVYDELPQTIVTHWGVDGIPNGWSPKAMVVFGIPSFMLLLNCTVWFMLHNDPKMSNIPKIMLQIGKWFVPILTLTMETITLFYTLYNSPEPARYIPFLLGLFIAAVGNYLPKCRPSYTVGIRLPWTLYDEENWVKTHRFGGKIWTICGFLIILAGFFSSEYLLMLAVFLMLVPPVVYSYLIYRNKHK